MPITTWTAMYSDVNSLLRRGTVYFGDVGRAMEIASRTLENEFTFSHMRKINSFVFPTGSEFYTSTDRIKSISVLNLASANGQLIPLRKVEYEQLTRTPTPTRRPEAYCQVNKSLIRFDASPDQAYTIHYEWFAFSTYDDANGFLGQDTNLNNLLRAETMLQLHPVVRDDKILQRWGPIREKAMALAKNAALERDWDHGSNQMIPYTDDVEEWDGVLTEDFD